MMIRIISKMVELVRQKAYCQMILTFHGGQITIVHINQTFKPDEIPLNDPDLLKQVKNGAARIDSIAGP